jgi:hypothetical protein
VAASFGSNDRKPSPEAVVPDAGDVSMKMGVVSVPCDRNRPKALVHDVNSNLFMGKYVIGILSVNKFYVLKPLAVFIYPTCRRHVVPHHL